MKSTGEELGRREKAKGGGLWDWIKRKMTDTSFFYTGGCRRVSSQQLA